MQKRILKSDNQKRFFFVIFAFIFGGLILVSIVLTFYTQDGSGFQGKTLWDWLDLLLVPILLILLLPGANWVVRKAQARNALVEQEIALDNHREKAVQIYMDLMTELIIEKGLGSREDHDE
jgi:hypothetical protein